MELPLVLRVADWLDEESGRAFRPKYTYRASLRHTLLYFQGALMPGSDKTCNQFQIQVFLISRSYHSKWLSSYVNHISGQVLALN